MPGGEIGDFRVLYEIARAVNSTLATKDLLSIIVKSVTEALRAKGSALQLIRPGERELIYAEVYGLSENYLKKGPVMIDPIAEEVSKGNPILILDSTFDRRVQYPEAAKREGIASILSVPLMHLNEVIGILRIYTSESRFFTQEEVEFVRAVANLSAVALVRAKEHEDRVADLMSQVDSCSLELNKLQQGRKYLMRFLAMVGHDLKAPISAVDGYLNVMKAGIAGPLTEKQKTMMERSSVRLRDLVTLINDLVDISRLEAGQIPMEVVKLSPEPIIEASLEVVRGRAQQKELKLITDFTLPLPEVVADKRRLQQMLVNLLSNAVRYTPPQGVITLRIKDEDSQVQFEVMDTGIGIPPDDLPHVFEEFFRGSNVEGKGGTGLGLSISRRIVEYLGGRIWVESPCLETGKGSKFSFTLPKEKIPGGVAHDAGQPPLLESLT